MTKKFDRIIALVGASLAELCTAVRVRSGSKDAITKANGDYVRPANAQFLRVGDATCYVAGIATMRGRSIGGTYLRVQIIDGTIETEEGCLSRGDEFTLVSAGAASIECSELTEAEGMSAVFSALDLPEPDLSGDNLPARAEKAPPAAKPEKHGRVGLLVSQGAPSRFAANPTDLSDSPALAALDAMTDRDAG